MLIYKYRYIKIRGDIMLYDDMDELMRKAELPKLKEKFIKLLKSTNREGIDELISYIESTDFFTAPASTRFHSSHEGGLLEHSLNVYKRLNYRLKNDDLYKNLGYNDDTIILVSTLHDICKANCYEIDFKNVKNEYGEWVQTPFYTFNDKWPVGHGEKSVMLIQKYIKLTDEEMLAIRYHMGAYIDGEANKASQAFNLSPLSLALHIADEEATDIIENIEKK